MRGLMQFINAQNPWGAFLRDKKHTSAVYVFDTDNKYIGLYLLSSSPKNEEIWRLTPLNTDGETVEYYSNPTYIESTLLECGEDISQNRKTEWAQAARPTIPKEISGLVGEEPYIGAIEANPSSLFSLPDEYRNNEKVVLAATKRNPKLFEYASEELKKNRDFVGKALIESDDSFGGLLEFASEELKNDKPFVLKMLAKCGSVLQFLPEELREDEDVVLAAVMQDHCAFKWASKSAKENEKLQALAKISDFNIRKSFGEVFKNSDDRDFVLAAVNQDGLALQFASETLKDDREIVLAAVKKNWLALKHASQYFQNSNLKKIKTDGVFFVPRGVDAFITIFKSPKDKNEILNAFVSLDVFSADEPIDSFATVEAVALAAMKKNKKRAEIYLPDNLKQYAECVNGLDEALNEFAGAVQHTENVINFFNEIKTKLKPKICEENEAMSPDHLNKLKTDVLKIAEGHFQHKNPKALRILADILMVVFFPVGVVVGLKNKSRTGSFFFTGAKTEPVRSLACEMDNAIPSQS